MGPRRSTVDGAGHSTVRSRRIGRGPRQQRGWAGLLLLLIALVIAGWLARIALKQLTPADPGARTPATTAEPSSPASAVQRAKGVESEILKHAEDVQQRLDATEK